MSGNFGSFKEIVHLWDDRTGYERFELKRYAYKKDSFGDYKTIFDDRVKKVNFWKKQDIEKDIMFETDVPAETRVLIDRYYESEEPSTGHRKVFFDIEVDMEDHLPNIETADNHITAISLYDEVADEYFVFILDLKNQINHTRYDNKEIIPFSNEEDLLIAFIQKWEEINPTIITGWNIDNFDVPYLYRRIKNTLGNDYAKKLSSIGIIYWNKHRNRYFIGGISCLDYLALYKNFTFSDQSSYTLDAISKSELGEGKIQYDGSLQKLMEDDINKFIEYNLVDTELVVKLDRKLNFIDLVVGICHKGHVPYEDIYYSSRWIEGAMLVFMRKLGLVAPNKNQKNRELMGGSDRFSGAYVKSPESALYNWLYDLDFTSLYPSIVMTLNISPETKIGKVELWDIEKHLKNKELQYDVVISEDNYRLTGKEIDSILKQHNLGISANGVLYKQESPGIIPQILGKWYEDKDNYDKLMKQYGQKGDKEKSKYFKQRRTISKVMLNSVYGVLGLPVFRFYNIDNASAVTTTGVNLIQFAQKMANHYYNRKLNDKKDYCVYIDTDSLYLLAEPLIKANYPDVNINDPKQMSKYILEVVKEMQDYLNRSFDLYAKKFLNLDKHKFDIKQEVIARSGIWVAKKRYALWIINESGVSKDELDYKGLDVVRSSFPQLFRLFMKEILTDILKNVDREKIDDKIIEFKKKIKSVDIVEIASPTSVKNLVKYGTKSEKNSIKFGNWIKGTPAHVKASISYNEFIKYNGLQKKYAEIKNGEKIKWVYLKENSLGLDSMAFRGYDDPPEVIEFINKYVDKEKIFDRVLLHKIEDFYKALNRPIPSSQKKIINKYFD